jgi:hypothetical protein
MLVRMTQAYDLLFLPTETPEESRKNMAKAEPLMKNYAKGIFEHIRLEFNKPTYNSVRKDYQPAIDEMDKAIRDATLGLTQWSRAMDLIRDTIHRDTKIRQLFVCGPVLGKNNQTNTAKAIFQALENMGSEDGSPESARLMLTDFSEKHTCQEK